MKIYKLSTVLTILLIAIVQSGCYYDSIPAITSIDREVSFTTDIIPIFNNSCNNTGCHNTGGIKPDLSAAKALSELTQGTKYINQSTPEQSLIYEVLKGTPKLMPPGGKLSDTEIGLVLAWIEQGVQNN